MADRVARADWSATPLGARTLWPQSLRTAVDIVLGSRQAMALAWGPERTFLYNDAYAPLLGPGIRRRSAGPSPTSGRRSGTTSALRQPASSPARRCP